MRRMNLLDDVFSPGRSPAPGAEPGGRDDVQGGQRPLSGREPREGADGRGAGGTLLLQAH